MFKRQVRVFDVLYAVPTFLSRRLLLFQCFRSMINYEDFCSALEESASRDGVVRGYDGNALGSTSRRPRSELYNSHDRENNRNRDRGADSRLPRERERERERRWAGEADNENWVVQSSVESSPRGSANADTFSRFRSTLSGFRDVPNHGVELDDGSESGFADSLQRALSPPKVTDSSVFRGGYSRPGSANRSSVNAPTSPRESRRGGSSLYDSPSASHRGSHHITPVAPRASPSRVGSLIWGSHTPLAQKGTAPYIDEATWCCTVCLYAENPTSATQCTVCDSPNYTVRTVSCTISFVHLGLLS